MSTRISVVEADGGTGTDPMLALVDTAPQISRPRLRLRW